MQQLKSFLRYFKRVLAYQPDTSNEIFPNDKIDLLFVHMQITQRE